MKRKTYAIFAAAGISLFCLGALLNIVSVRKPKNNTINLIYEIYHVREDTFRVSKTEDLYSRGLLPCSVVCLYDKNKKIGTFAHFRLPKNPDDWGKQLSLEKIVWEMQNQGANIKDTESILVRYVDDKNNSSKYLLNALGQFGIKNKKDITYTERLWDVNLDTKRGIVGINRGEYSDKYTF